MGDSTVELVFDLLEESARAFDYNAAESATPDEARRLLKVLKHYVRVSFGSDGVNSHLKMFLNCCGIEPEVPGSVAGGYDFALNFLKTTHKCSGKDCVMKHRGLAEKKSKTPEKKSSSAAGEVNRGTKQSVKQPKIKAKKASHGLKRNKRNLPSYVI